MLGWDEKVEGEKKKKEKKKFSVSRILASQIDII